MAEIEPQKEQVEVQAQKNQEEPDEKIFNPGKVEISEVKNFVYFDKGILLGNDTFASEQSQQNVPEIFMRPLIVGEPGKEISAESSESAIDVKSTIAMGKAACIEYPTSIDGQDYNFVQWKGIGANKTTETIPQRAGTDWHFPFGHDGIAPLFTAQSGKWVLVRFMGTAYYDDLLREKQQYEKIVAKTDLRTSKILGTFKFTREFCQAHNLPMPENDDPNNHDGQSLGEYIDARLQDVVNDEEKENLLTLRNNPELDFESSAICGENVRAFRNVWRVMEVESALKETDETKRKEKISAILGASKKVFAKEFGQEIDNNEFVKRFSSLMGEQTAILLNNKIIQGAMLEHKQDVTLAAEVCDWDTSSQITDEYLHDNENYPDWVNDEKDRKEWEQQKYLEMYRQVFLMASNIKPVLEASQQMGATETEESAINNFVDGLLSNLSDDEKKRFKGFIKKVPDDFQSVEGIAGKIKGRDSEPNGKILENFEGYQEYFDALLKDINKKLKQKK